MDKSSRVIVWPIAMSRLANTTAVFDPAETHR
jgi:hypothetical protein